MAAVCFQEPEVVIARPQIEVSSFVPWETWDVFLPKTEVNLRRYNRYLVKSIWLHNYVTGRLNCIKFGRPMTVNRSKWELGIDFQYGRHWFLATESSNISAVNWDIWFKFVMQIVLFYVCKCETSQHRKGEVDLRRCNQHMAAILGNLHINVITLSLVVQLS